jgi:agmatinase
MDQITKGKFVGVVGGDHSSPLGLIKALNDTQIEKFGILHVDAHHDLREAYEGFTYSHASIFYNAMNECEDISNLVQIGIRDYSSEEANRMIEYGKKGACLYDTDMQAQLASGKSLEEVFAPYIEQLPQNVYLSIDIDGLEPLNCPNTGTPVPGGLRYSELEHLIFMVVKSGRNIIAFDLCEVGTSDDEWDANVGARVLYQLCGALLASQGKIEYK